MSNTATLNLGTVAHTITGALTGSNTATINLGTAATTLTGNFTTAAGNTLDVNIISPTTAGLLSSGGTVSFAVGTKVAVNVATTGYIANGTKFEYIAGGSADSETAGTIASSSPFISFTDDTGTGGERQVDAVVATFQSVAGTTDTKNVGTALSATIANANIITFQGAVQDTATAAAADAILKQALPQVNATATQAITLSGESMDVAANRLGELRAGIDNSASGMTAGGKVADKGVWIQGFGTTATQDLRSGVDGYDANTYGGAVGADMAVSDKARVGISASYGKTNVDSNGSADQKADIDSYQGNLYGTYNMGQWYTDGLLGYAYQKFDTTRVIAANPNANGSFNGETYTARIDGGYHYMTSNGLDIIPNSALTYYYNHTNGYTETGAGGMDLHVNSDNNSSLIGRIGVDVAHDFHQNSAIIRPVLRVGYLYQFTNDQVSTTSQFTGGGATFNTKDASPAKSTFDAGASLDIFRADNISFAADYDFEAKSGYTSNSGMLRARFNF